MNKSAYVVVFDWVIAGLVVVVGVGNGALDCASFGVGLLHADVVWFTAVCPFHEQGYMSARAHQSVAAHQGVFGDLGGNTPEPRCGLTRLIKSPTHGDKPRTVCPISPLSPSLAIRNLPTYPVLASCYHSSPIHACRMSACNHENNQANAKHHSLAASNH